MGFIDCDSHVFENESTWDYLDPSERMYRPKVAQFAHEEAPGIDPPRAWIVGDTWARRPPSNGNIFGNGNVYDDAVTQLTDPALRIQDIDALGIDFQVLISTFFIGVELDNPVIEAAITRAYNRWIADLVSDHRDRFGWTLRAPLRNMDRAMEELEFGKEHGAVGIHMRGKEHGMFLSDPWFWPLYEKAQDLDLAIVVHFGVAARRLDLPVGTLLPYPEALMDQLMPSMTGLHAVVASDLNVRFPRLRFGFVEAGASWAPAVLQKQSRLLASKDQYAQFRRITPEQLAEKNVFITCDVDEDLPYLVEVLGDGVLCAGTDYAHNDSGADLGVHSSILMRTDLDSTVAQKIVDSNGRRLYSIDANHRPAPPPNPKAELLHVSGARTPDGRPLVRALVS